MVSMLLPLWAYRGFILGSVKRDFQSKYRASLLGATWSVLNPLAMVVVYTVIFSNIMKARLPGSDSTLAYSIYLFAGVITWGLFAEITGRAQNIFLEYANLLKKLNFPRLCLPMVVVLNATINFLIIFGLVSAFLIVSGNFPGFAYLALIPLLLIQMAFSIGLGIILGVLNVFFRDVGHLFNVILQFWFWLTPIVYPISILPASAQGLMQYNPMASLIAAYQGIFIHGLWPQWSSLWLVVSLAVVANLVGFRLFRKHAGEIVDEI